MGELTSQTSERGLRRELILDALQTTAQEYLQLPPTYPHLAEITTDTAKALAGLEVKDSVLNDPRTLTISMGIVEHARDQFLDLSRRRDLDPESLRKSTKLILQQQHKKLGYFLKIRLIRVEVRELKRSAKPLAGQGRIIYLPLQNLVMLPTPGN